MRTSLIASLSLLVISAQAQAQDFFPSIQEYQKVQAQGRTSVTLDVENDSLLLNRDDGFYTSGNHLIVRQFLVTPQQSTTYAWHVGQDLYTASDIKLRPGQISKFDHPYAAWLYAGVFKQVQRQDGSGTKLGIELGCLGPCAAGEWTQTNLHRLFNQPLPQAWSTQLKQEWGAVLNAEISPAAWKLSTDSDVGTRFKARAGNIFTDAKAEIMWRYGRLNSSVDAPGSFVFSRAELKVVGYNASLQGGYFRDQKLIISPNRLVPEMEFGYQYRGETWGFYASVLRRGSEIKELSNAKGAQNFAKLQLTQIFH
nr:lipid A-modifier LpxR family protein [uncultured Undibacterium sp.]